MRVQESQEMYLETILELSQNNEKVRSVDIVNAMGFAKSSVSQAVKQLKELEYIKVDVNGEITLTEIGKTKAESVLEKHKVLTDFLVQLGIDYSVAEEDACKIEHVISDATFDAIKQNLKN